MAFVTRSQNVRDRDARHSFAKHRDLRHSALDFVSALLRLRHKTRDGTAMAGDDNGFASLDLAQELGQVSLCIGGLNFTHRKPLSVGQFDWSIYTMMGRISNVIEVCGGCRRWCVHVVSFAKRTYAGKLCQKIPIIVARNWKEIQDFFP
jgi:hypothetical protein